MAAVEAMETIAPFPCASIRGSTALQHRKALLRLTSIWLSQVSSLMVAGSPGREWPTLLTRMSMRPRRSTQSATSASTVALSVTSPTPTTKVPPSPSTMRRVSSAASRFTSTP